MLQVLDRWTVMFMRRSGGAQLELVVAAPDLEVVVRSIVSSGYTYVEIRKRHSPVEAQENLLHAQSTQGVAGGEVS